jgi:hypothetical protein
VFQRDPVLIAEQHELAVAEPRLAAGVVHKHHRQQPVNLGVLRKQFGERASQPHRLRREFIAAAVALVEDQVDDGEDGVETLAEQVSRWHPERDRRSSDLALGPHQPLRHRGIRYQEGTGDLVGGEPAEGAQGERDLCLDRERRVTAGEDELQALVGKRRGVHRHLSTIARGEQAHLGGEGPVAADAIRGPVPGRRHQPGARVAGDAVARPSVGGHGERVLGGFLGEVEVAEEADQGGQDAAPFLAEDLVERGYQYTSEGRISTAPP